MPQVSAPTHEEARVAFDEAAREKALIAFAAGCRLAARPVRSIQCRGCVIDYQFVVLSPGETPEGKGWTIYELHGDQVVGRLA